MSGQNPEINDFNRSFSDRIRGGKSPQAFIIDQVASLRQVTARQQEMDRVEPMPLGNGDIAYLIQFWADQGAVSIEEVTDSQYLQTLGLSDDEAAVFVSETLPEIRVFMHQESERKLEEAAIKQKELTMQFLQHWSLERIDGIASYFHQHESQLNKVNPYWGASLLRFHNQREQLQKDYKQITDPMEQMRFLMRQAYYVTYFHPSELEQIFQEEIDTGTYPYLDSLLQTAIALYPHSNGKDPDISNAHIASGNISLTVGVYTAGDPDSMMRRNRKQAMENLVFGARTPTETSSIIKKRNRPLRRAPAQTSADS